MILIAGGTGMLGGRVVRLLTERGQQVRILTRVADRDRHLTGRLVETVPGDVRDLPSLRRAVAGVDTIISAISGFGRPGKDNPRTVDGEGNSNLIRAAEEAGAKRFILVSILGAAADHPIELYRLKYRAEQELRSSGLDWTIIRPAIYMERWSAVVSEPLLKSGKTRIAGPGTNPISFVAADDVARFVDLALADPALRGVLVELGGPENLTQRRFVEIFQTATGRTGSVSYLPLPMVRLVGVLMRVINPMVARFIQAGIVMETTDMTFDSTEISRRYPSIPLTSLAEVVRRNYVSETTPARSPAMST